MQIFSLACQSVNLFSKQQLKMLIGFLPIFVADTKWIYVYNFVAHLNSLDIVILHKGKKIPWHIELKFYRRCLAVVAKSVSVIFHFVSIQYHSDTMHCNQRFEEVHLSAVKTHALQS